jgi:RNA recognition motif-containing protein
VKASSEGERNQLTKRIYVGNLPFQTTEQQVRELFGRHGTVQSVTMVTDAQTGQFRGFGFVEMAPAQAEKAIAALNGRAVGGRKLRVNEAQPRPNRGKERRRGRRPSAGSQGDDFRVRDGYRQSGNNRNEQFNVRSDFLKSANTGEGFRARDAYLESGGNTGEGYRARDEFQHIEDNARDNRKRSKGSSSRSKPANKKRRRR